MAIQATWMTASGGSASFAALETFGKSPHPLFDPAIPAPLEQLNGG
jgi:hypothetical protein